jgi:hypothetical protein
MGYSCTAKAALVLDAVQAIFEQSSPGSGSNRMPGGGFWERGREQADGAITGTTWKLYRVLSEAERLEAAAKQGCPDHPEWIGNPVTRAGSFKIAADGKIVRFPGLSRAQKAAAEAKGAAEYARKYPPIRATWPGAFASD